MMDRNHFICHFYCNFSMFSRLNLSGKTWCSGRNLMTSSDSVCKIMSCCFIQSVFDLVYHLYGICRMYSEENPQDFRLPVPCLYSWEWVMLFLSAEAAFKPGGSLPWELTSENLSQPLVLCRPSLAYEGSGYPIFRAEPSVGIISIYGVGSHASYPNAHKLLLHTETVLKAYTLIERLERDVLNEGYSVYLYIVDFCTELNGLDSVCYR